MADHSGWAAQEKAILQGKAANILYSVPTRETCQGANLDDMVVCYIKALKGHPREVILTQQGVWDERLPLFLPAYGA
jgi:hypothetical protein